MKQIFTILGCGSSGGVPRIGGKWGVCDPTNPKNRRQRCSLLVEKNNGPDVTRVLIDTTPDMRQQLINAEAGTLDGVLYTHTHADHVHGIDDLRQVAMNMQDRVPVWATETSAKVLLSRFDYVFTQPKGSSYPPILEMNLIQGDVSIEGAGGIIKFQPIVVEHGRIDALGFRIGDVAYIPDVSEIPETSWPLLEGLSCLIIDALRYKPHSSHAHLEKTLSWIERLAPAQSVLTNMHYDLDYATLQKELPETVIPAYDGLRIVREV